MTRVINWERTEKELRMGLEHLQYQHKVITTQWGSALGVAYQWNNEDQSGQYCAIHTDRGILGCGLYDCNIATRFGYAVAIARGTPNHPLRTPEDLLGANVAEVSDAANSLGIMVGMSGLDAIKRLLVGLGVEHQTH